MQENFQTLYGLFDQCVHEHQAAVFNWHSVQQGNPNALPQSNMPNVFCFEPTIHGPVPPHIYQGIGRIQRKVDFSRLHTRQNGLVSTVGPEKLQELYERHHAVIIGLWSPNPTLLFGGEILGGLLLETTDHVASFEGRKALDMAKTLDECRGAKLMFVDIAASKQLHASALKGYLKSPFIIMKEALTPHCQQYADPSDPKPIMITFWVREGAIPNGVSPMYERAGFRRSKISYEFEDYDPEIEKNRDGFRIDYGPVLS